MTTHDNFDKHIGSITPKQWQHLFSLLSELQQSTKINGVKSIETHHLVLDIIETIISSGMLVKFDHTKCYLVDQLLQNNNYKKLDSIQVCKALTYIIEKDKFSFNVIQCYFEMGVIEKLLLRIKDIVMQ